MVAAVKVGNDWLRAKIVMQIKSYTDLEPRREFLVKLVDTGKVEIVPGSSIEVLQPKFLCPARQVSDN